MKKITVLSMGMCAVLALASCGTSKEIAQMLSGSDITQAALANAKELLRI